jgi:sulfoxide reductase catalytic subunit YedY
MILKMRKENQIKSFEITPEKSYINRRSLIKSLGILSATPFFSNTFAENNAPNQKPLDFIKNNQYSTTEPINSFEDITTYNNYYEFGLDKTDPYRFSTKFKPFPWTITVTGEAENTGHFNYEDIVSTNKLEERIYRLRCVEAWSMVIPWIGIPLVDIIKKFKPTSNAKYVAFETVYRPNEMPGQRRRNLDWPYVEGLTIEEATHPLSLLAVGLYGRELPNQNGAPLRLVVPWKYGFKSIKSIVKIHFQEKQPPTTWNLAAANEYGFYANVNPEVNHPRWSQARERRLGSGFFGAKQPTLLFNGYANAVGHLYSDLDLKKYF